MRRLRLTLLGTACAIAVPVNLAIGQPLNLIAAAAAAAAAVFAGVVLWRSR